MSTDFGSDISCTWGVDPRCAVVTGRRLLAEAVFRRLITPRGRLIDDPEYGTDITAYLNDDVSPRTLAMLKSAIVAECAKEERIEGASVIITPPAMTAIGAYIIEISLESAEGPFTLTISATNVTVALLNVAA
jgi:phage baseplate assembly protein W